MQKAKPEVIKTLLTVVEDNGESVGPRQLITSMVDAGHAAKDCRLAIQVAIENGLIVIGKHMKVYMEGKGHTWLLAHRL